MKTARRRNENFRGGLIFGSNGMGQMEPELIR